jgi:wobble nucleotide-excising tRNase
MIKQFNQIKNVGAFRDFPNGGSVQFEKLTFVYGLNTRGKTTLTEILCSLRDNNPILITERKSIPEVTSDQAVILSVRPETTGNQESYRFNNGSWTQGGVHQNLHIFGSEFIHKNLFTGLAVQRQNKENLTQFILGQEGVELASKIAEDKKSLRQKRGSIGSLVPPQVQNNTEEEIQAFLEIDPSAIDLEQSKQELVPLQERLRQEQQRLEKPSEIISIPDFSEFLVPENSVERLATRTCTLLEREYGEISAEALEHIKLHIDQNFEIKDNSERWIKEGLDSKSDASNNCGFCGQSLSNAAELIEAYHLYFNEAYRDFISEISTESNQLEIEWHRISLNNFRGLTEHYSLLSRYQQVIGSPDFEKLVNDFNELTNSRIEQDLNELLSETSSQLSEVFQAKKQKPHESIMSPDFSELIRISSLYFIRLQESSNIIHEIRRAIQEFKESYLDLTEIRSRIEKINTEIDSRNTKIARIEQNQQCVSYREALEELNTIADRISVNEGTLSREQSQYLENFYDKINYYFRRFGSENYSLEIETNNRGHQPVYFLKVKFRGVEIDESNFKNVFSESDKRALALSIFWSKIDLLDTDPKNKAIIILDDPITSFDDNRIGFSLDIIKETLSSVCQIIILTHYSHFVRIFCEKSMNDDFTPSFIEINQDSSTSFLTKTTKDQFIETAYEKMFKKIQSYINRESAEDIRMILRPFLESQYIPHFYIDKLREAKSKGIPCGTLNEMIEAIFEGNDVKRRFHRFRESLNPDSHIFTSANEEDVRGFARDMMNYLYNFNYV